MGWTTSPGMEWPPIAGTRISAWEYIVQLWSACVERGMALGNRWPRTYAIYGSGTITGFTDNGDGTFTIEDSAATGWMPGGSRRWFDYDVPPGAPPDTPKFYDLIIEVNGWRDYEKIIHVEILDNTETTITVGTWIDWVTARWLSSVSAGIVGAKFFIIKRGGTWHHERLPISPNAQELIYSTCTGDKFTVPGTTPVTYSRISHKFPWAGADKPLAGKDLVVWADDGRMKRVTIVGSNAWQIWFAEQTWTAGGTFTVVQPGGKAWAGRSQSRERWGIFPWYAGAMKEIISHQPNDQLGAAKRPETSITFSESFSAIEPCEDTPHEAFDADVWSEPSNFCAPEFNYSRWIYSTIRGIQQWIQEVASSWVLRQSYEGASCIPLSTYATLLYKANVNAGDGVVSGPDDDDKFYITVDAAYAGKVIYGTIIGSATAPCARPEVGGTADEAGKVIIGEGEEFGEAYSGRTVQYTASWSRFYPRMVLNMFYPTGAWFMPDIDEEAAIDPPAVVDMEESGDLGTGTWVAQEDDVSTTYFQYAEPAANPENTVAFVEGELARFVGQTFSDGTENVTVTAPDTPYLAHRFVGLRLPRHQKMWDDSRAGLITAGSTTSMTDSSRDWWAVDWMHQVGRPSVGTLRTDEGVATGGSTTTLVDASKVDLPANEPACFWWRSSRFTGFSSPWAGFILEVDKEEPDPADPGETITVTYKMPILSGSSSTGTLTFAAVPGVTIEAGDVYRIKEPAYKLNQWKGRKLLVRKPDGTTIETTITHNDNDTLFFSESAEPLQPGWMYAIIEHQPDGSVWKWTEDGWVKPTGPDARVPTAVFRDGQKLNYPTKVTDYGRMRRQDYVTIELLTELYKVLNEMVWTKANADWQWPQIHEENVPPATVNGDSITGITGADFSAFPGSPPFTNDHPEFWLVLDGVGSSPSSGGASPSFDPERGVFPFPPPDYYPPSSATAARLYSRVWRSFTPLVSEGEDVTDTDYDEAVAKISANYTADALAGYDYAPYAVVGDSNPRAVFSMSKFPTANHTVASSAGGTVTLTFTSGSSAGDIIEIAHPSGDQDLAYKGVIVDPNPEPVLTISPAISYDASGMTATIYPPGYGFYFSNNVVRVRSRIHASGLRTLLASNAEFYSFAIKPGEPDDGNVLYDANGEAAVPENSWHQIGSVVSQDAERWGNVVGNVDGDPPNTPPEPVNYIKGYPAFTSAAGYVVVDQCCIQKWDVAGGLQYISP